MDNPEKLAQDEVKHQIICVGHHYMHANTNNINKTLTLLQTTGGKVEQNIVFKHDVSFLTYLIYNFDLEYMTLSLRKNCELVNDTIIRIPPLCFI